MKVGILGGSFDPPHLGHLLIASQIVQLTKINKVILMPVYKHAFNKKLTSATNRMEMVKLVVEKLIEASDLEIRQRKVSITINTLRALHKKFPQDKFFLIIGSDQLEKFDQWDDWEKIIAEFGLVIFPRGVGEKEVKKMVKKLLRKSNLSKEVIILSEKKFKLTNISSSNIRVRVHQQKSIQHLVDPKVEEYIIKHQLYR